MEGDSFDEDVHLTKLLELAKQDEEDAGSRSSNGTSEPLSPTPGPSQKKPLNELTYEDLFGSPDKKRPRDDDSDDESTSTKLLRTANGRSHSTNSLRSNLTASSAMAQLGSNPVAPTSIQMFNPANSVRNSKGLIVDGHSGVRVWKSTIDMYQDGDATLEDLLRNRNLGLHFVKLPNIGTWTHNKSVVEQKNFWTSAVLVRKQQGIRTSAKGNKYAIWEVNDLTQVETTWTLFLFSGSVKASSLQEIPVGSLIDIVTPSVLPDSKNSFKLSINKHTQISRIGNASDFGVCSAKKKDGKPCTAIVNTAICGTCIHHAASELRRLNNSKKAGSRSKKKAVSFGGDVRFNKTKTSFDTPDTTTGVFTVNMGPYKKPNPQTSLPKFIPKSIPNTRMELQGTSTCNEVKRNSLKLGNSSSISFLKEKAVSKPVASVNISVDPLKTRHLTDADRKILSALSSPTKKQELSKGCKPEIASKILANPTAGSRNFMKFLCASNPLGPDGEKLSKSEQSKRKQPVTMNSETLKNIKKALDLVKTKGPFKPVDPNAVRRKSAPSKMSSNAKDSTKDSSKSTKPNVEVQFEFESEDFKKILNAKSAHAEHAEDVEREEYFNKLEKKEAIENKLLNTFTIATTAVMCRQCKYVALSQSDYCKESLHTVRMVKTNKRFFKCKDCGNRTMSLDRLPKHPCKNCNSSRWIPAPVGKEKTGPVLASEVLSLRGNEEKFLGSSSSNMYLNLEV